MEYMGHGTWDMGHGIHGTWDTCDMGYMGYMGHGTWDMRYLNIKPHQVIIRGTVESYYIQ